jgi:tripartite-type tricarboxylate transporter receptor subunit TctC
MFKRIIVAAAAVTCLYIAAAIDGPAAAEDYPARTIAIIVPQPPGGGTDIISRIVGHQLSEQLKQSVIIENRAGAGTVVGSTAAAAAAPDGYTLLAGLTANMAVNPSLFAKLPYDPVRDFTPVGMMAEYPFVLVVNKDFPAHSVKEFIDLAKAKPGTINVASAGNGSGQHLSLELFKLMTGVQLTHVPYRGAAPAYTDVLSGATPAFFDNLSSAIGKIKGGQVRALAVTSRKRAALLPDVPTVAETVRGYENTVWFGLWAPKNTPPAILAKLNAEIAKAVASPDVKSKIEGGAGVPLTMSIPDIEKMQKADIAKWGDVIKRANIKVN